MGTTDQPASRVQVQRLRGKLAELVETQMRRDHLRNYEEFADKYGIGRSTLYELLRGRTRSRGVLVKPSLDTLVKLATALRRPTYELLYLFEPDAPGATDFQASTPPTGATPVTVVGTIGGGPEQHEDLPPETLWVELGFTYGKDLIAFRVHGDSMAAGTDLIQHDDRILVDRNDAGHNTASVVARLRTQDLVLKMLKDDRFGRILHSRNPEPTNDSPTVIPMQDVAEIIGRVVRIIHDTKPTPHQ